MNNQVSKAKRKNLLDKDLPVIPDKLYFTISEVGFLCAVKAYVLRYWEQEFLQLRPAKRRGNRRFYKKADIQLIRYIRKLLYEDGFTIEGARAQLSQTVPAAPKSKEANANVTALIVDLENVLAELQVARG